MRQTSKAVLLLISAASAADADHVDPGFAAKEGAVTATTFLDQGGW